MTNRATPSRPCAYPGCPHLAKDGSKTCDQHQLRVTVVSGLPGSGKSTYVEQHKRHGDIVWDQDVMMAALCGLPLGEKQPDCVRALVAMRQGLVSELVGGTPCRPAWVIVTSEDVAQQIAADCGAEIVRCEVGEVERQRRLAGR